MFSYSFLPEVASVTNVETARGVRPGKEMVFIGKNLEVIVGVSKVKFIKLIPIPEMDMNGDGSDDDGVSNTSHKTNNTQTSQNTSQLSLKKRKQLLTSSYQDGPTAVVPCLNRRGGVICCDIPFMGDDVTPMRIELYIDGLRVNEVISDLQHIRSQVPFPFKPTYSTIDIEYAGSIEDPPPEPPDEE